MNVIEKNIEDLKPYKKNARLNDDAVEVVANSIKEFGFRVPILIEKDGTIVAGHTRFKACKKLHIQKVPCIVVDDLTEEQIKAYRLADNKVSEKAEWDFSLLDEELSQIVDINMADFGFDFELDEQEEEDKPKEEKINERIRTNDAYNLGVLSDENYTKDFWQMPIIKNNNFIPTDLIGINYAKTNENKEVGIHFFVDDYQFERVWNYPEKYIDTFFEYDCIFSPDFSLYMDMPMSMKIWNVYRSRWIGAYYQSKGIKVIPTISWAESDTFEFCFKGIPQGSIVSISTIGVKKNKDALQIWKDGVTEMIKQIHPKTILVYGGELEYDYGDINVVYFENKVLKNWKERS